MVSICYARYRLRFDQKIQLQTYWAVIWEQLPIILLMIAVTLTAFGFSVLVGAHQYFPYRII